MLKAPPHDFRAGAVAPTAPHKPAELGNPGDRLAQRRRLGRWRGDPMDGTIQRLPFVEAPTGRYRAHQAPPAPAWWHKKSARPGHCRAPSSGASAPPSANCRASRRHPLFKIRCQTSMPQRQEYHWTRSMASSTVSTATVVNNSHSMGSTSAGGSTSLDLHGPQRDGRQAFGFAMRGGTQGQGTKAQRQRRFPGGLRAATRDVQDGAGPPRAGPRPWPRHSVAAR